MRTGAWLPWLLLHVLASRALLEIPEGGLKLLVPLVVYGVVSWILGLIVCLYLRKDLVSVGLAALFLFGGPFFSYAYLEVRAAQRHDDFLAATEMVERLCAEHGGKKIYRTVDNVEGVFQMRARNPSYKVLRDPLMADPWSRAVGDYDSLGQILALEGKGYFFVEQQPEYGMPEGPPFYRTYLQYAEEKMARYSEQHPGRVRLFYDRHRVEVEQLKSRYGWITEDLTSEDMRELWVGGGRIKVVDLMNGDILGEYTGFFRAAGPGGRNHWANYRNGVQCPYSPFLIGFLREVLKPVERIPSAKELDSFKE